MLVTSCSACSNIPPESLARKRESSEPAAAPRLRRLGVARPARLCPTVDIVRHRPVHCIVWCRVVFGDVSPIVERAFYPLPDKTPATRGAAVPAARNCTTRKSKEV